MANKPLPAPAQPSGQWHLQEVHALTQEHGVDPAHGLHVHQVNDRALQFGPNALPTADQRSLGSLVLEQFSDDEQSIDQGGSRRSKRPKRPKGRGYFTKATVTLARVNTP